VAPPLLATTSGAHQAGVAVCAATRQGGHRGTAGYCGHQGWFTQSCGRWGVPVGPTGCTHVVLPLLATTSGAHQTGVAVCGHQGAGVHRGTAGSCGQHGYLAPCSRCWGALVGPNGVCHVALPLLAATSGAHQGQIAVCGHSGGGSVGSTYGLCGHNFWHSQSSGC